MIRKLLCFFLIGILCFSTCAVCSAGRIENDPAGTTTAIDNRSDLPDGIYTPDSFAFSGGTGKVKITCPQIEIRDGQSWALLRFSSSSYQYVKTNGMIYYSDVVEGKAEFVIPIVLNQNQRIPALTTKMSDPHEIEYTIFVQLTQNGRNESDSDILDETAPEIAGWQSLQNTISARDLRAFQYQNGAVLFEVDTQRESVPTEEIPEEERTAADDLADLYRKKVLKYLAVPEGTELPAGSEKQYIVIRKPIHGIYAASPQILTKLEGFGIQPDAVGFAHDTIPFAGTPEKPDYRAWILSKLGSAFADGETIALLSGSLADRLAALGIPLVLDLSNTDDALQWQQLYTLLFDTEV